MYDAIRQPNFDLHEDAIITITLPLFLCNGCGKNMSGFVPVAFFSSFFPFSSSVLKPTPTHYQSNLSIYFFFGFNLFIFIAIFFILDYPYN
jgi:hypothetical protein